MTQPNTVNHTQEPAQWTVLGAGAMGCLWAACIQRQLGSQAVTLVVRDGLTSTPAKHIRLETATGKQDIALHIAPSRSYSGSLQYLLVATKAQDVHAAIDSIEHLIGSQTVIVLLQNGLKTHYETVARFGAQRVVSISTSNGAYLRSPFHVVHAGTGETWLGQVGCDDLLARRLVAQLPSAELNIRHDSNISERLWRKFAINCCINILTALYQVQNGELLTNTYAKAEFETLCDEVESILGQTSVAPAVGNIFEQSKAVALATAENYSSTLQDVRKQQKTELAQFNRYLCNLARDNAVDCSFNCALLERFERLYPGLSLD